MTREKIEEFLYMGCKNTNVVSQRCMNMKSCRSCIQEELAEYEKQIRADLIDKVVKELEDEIKLYENSMSIMGGNDTDIEYYGAMKGLGKAIEIIKQGD